MGQMPWDVWDSLSRVISLNFWSPTKSPARSIYIHSTPSDLLELKYPQWFFESYISHMIWDCYFSYASWFCLPDYAHSIVVLVCFTWILWWASIPNVFIEAVGIEYFLHLVLGKRLISNILLKAFLDLCIFISQSLGCRVRSHLVLEEAILRIWKSEGVVCISRSF